jgi:hypothetical protein
MRFSASLLTLTVLLTVMSVSVSAQTDRGGSQKKAQPKGAAGQTSLTGCVDQQDGRYILISDRTRDPIASLEADGFPTEGFARFVGHKVTVRGTSNPGTDRPLFKVRNIESISESCEPQH